MSKSRSRGYRVLADGRSDKSDAFAKLDHKLLDDPRFRALSAKATRVLILLLRRHNGFNNARIAMPVRAGRDWGLTKDAVGRGLHELIEAGFVEIVTRSAFTLKTRRAAEYRLRWLPVRDAEARTTQPPDFHAPRAVTQEKTTGAAAGRM